MIKEYISLKTLNLKKDLAKAIDVLMLTLFYFRFILVLYPIYEWNAIVALCTVNRNISFQSYKVLSYD